MVKTSEVLVEQAQITSLALTSRDKLPLDDGQVRLNLQSFALTANNVTYAVTGFDIGYWNFFPSAKDGQGIVPVWGHAVVSETQSEHLAIGQRVYGFFPMAEELVIRPEPTSGRSLVDVSDHRRDLPAIYNLYSPADQLVAEADYYQAILQPLIATSFLLFDWLMDNDWFAANQLIIGSASSKTGLGLCKFLSENTGRPYKIVGLTSARNAEFVLGLGACDLVLTYDQIDQISQTTSVYIDMAGNSAVKTQLHDHLANNLAHSAAVGISHWDQFEQIHDLKGPKPKFFFAPAQIAKRRQEWGAGVIERKLAEASTKISKDAATWMDLKIHRGLGASIDVFKDIASGESRPSEGHVVVL